MIDLKIAEEIAKKVTNKFSVEPACETTHYFTFSPVNDRGEIIVNSCSVVVNKETGKAKIAHFTELVDEEIIKHY